MATIKEGFDGKPLEIRVSARDDGGVEVWVEQFDGFKYSEHDDGSTPRDDPSYRTETLAYATLEEVIKLRNELNTAIKEAAGV